MTDNELLLAISQMLDHKLKAELQPVKNGMQDMRTEMQDMRTEMQDMRTEMQDIRTEQQEMRAEMQDIRAEQQEMRTEMQDMRGEINRVKLFQENIIMPRLNTIESCYTDTFKRYRDHADRMDAAFQDIDLLKKVVAEHSEKLQKIS